jgi:hypothetical protein
MHVDSKAPTRRARCGIAAALVLGLAGCSATGEPTALAPTQEPSVPAADPQAESSGSDWIRLASDEWLRGEIELLRDESLEFESEELDTLELDWDKVVEQTIRPLHHTSNPIGVWRT